MLQSHDPERLKDHWAITVGMNARSFKIYSQAALLVARETIIPDALHQHIPRTHTQKIFADALFEADERIQHGFDVTFAIDDLPLVGQRLQGPWDSVSVLQHTIFEPWNVPIFAQSVVRMGEIVIEHAEKLQANSPELFTSQTL